MTPRAFLCIAILCGPALGAGEPCRVCARPVDFHASGHMAPLEIPQVPSSDVDAAHRDPEWPPAALTVSRFVRHVEATEATTYPFLLADDSLSLAKYRTTVRLAHDREHLYVAARMTTPPGKIVTPKTLGYGVWPGRDAHAGFDNTEFLAIVIDSGQPRSKWLPQFVYFIDWQGRVIHQRSTGSSPFAESDEAARLDVRVERADSAWRLTGRLPLHVPRDRPFKLNVARVTGWPERGIPVRASSWRGTFFAFNVFPTVSLGAARAVQPVGFSFGRTTAWLTFPRGEHTARLALLSERSGVRTTVRHAIDRGGEQTVVWEKELTLGRGLNQVSWEWEVGRDWADFRHRLTVDGQNVAKYRSKATPWLVLSPCERRVPLDGTLSLNVELGCMRNALQDLQLLVRLDDVGKRWEFKDLEEPCLDLDIVPRAAGLSAGEHRLQVELRDHAGNSIAAESHGVTVEEPNVPRSGPLSIPLVDASEGRPSVPYPVWAGIPFPQGAVRSLREVMLFSGQTKIRHSVDVLSRWSRDGSVKWARLGFVYNPRGQYRVGRALGGPRMHSEGGGKVESEECPIDAGHLHLSVGGHGFDGFRSLSLGLGWRVPIPTKHGGFYAIDEAGIRYDSAHAPGHTEVEEVAGTRVILKFSGACTSQDGIEVLRHIMRMTIHAELPLIEVSHTMVFTCNTRMYRFREIGLDLGLGTGGPLRVRQLSPEERHIKPDPDQQAQEVDRAGVFGFRGRGWNLAVAIRDLREKAPIELASAPDRGLSFLCWPDLSNFHPHRAADVRPANLPRLRFAHQGPLLDFNVPPEYQSQATSQSAGYLRAGIAMGNAMGVARTHEFVLAFGNSRTADPFAAARAYLKRPHVSATGQWMAETGAVGDLLMTPRGPADDTTVAGRVDTVLDRNFDWEMRKLAPVSPGKWTWGAAHSQWVERAGDWSSWRLFRNTHHGATKGYWYLFARSADAKYLAFARRSTEFVADVGMCHYADTDLRHLNYYGKIAGAVCDYKGYVPWHSGSRFGYNTYADFLINWYYLTGHPRAKDTLDELLRFYLRARRGGAGSGRPGASRMETACSLYAHTLDGRLLRYVNNSLATPRANQSDVGFIPAGKEFGTWLPYYLNLTADPVALDVLKRWAYADLKQPWWYDFDGKNWQPNWATQAYAYYCFRDPALLGPALARLERRVLDAAFLQAGHPEDGFIKAGNTAWSWLQQKIPSFLWALEDAGDAARPHYATETFSAFILDNVWSTWAVLDHQSGTTGDRRFQIRLRGRWQAEGEPAMQLVAANGKVVHHGPLPEFGWQQLGLSNPPIHPDEALLQVDPGKAPGPFYLQVRGQGGSVMVMLPLSTLPREVYHAGDNVRRHVTSFMRDPGRFPQLAQLQSQPQWFNACYGWRKLYFRVPKQGDRLDCYGVHGGFGLYNFHVEDRAGKRVVSKAGFNRTKFHAELLEGRQLATLRGQLAVFDAPCEKPRLYLILGADIPPFVSLSPEAFFVPERLSDRRWVW